MKYVISRYENSYLRLFKDAYYLSPQAIGTAVICVIWLIAYFAEIRSDSIAFPKCASLITSVYLLGELLNIRSCPLEDSLWVAKNNGLDYGSGMAYSFFHGYLDLVLRRTGTESKNLKELMQDYEDSHHINFPIYKLFILIPTSLRCFTSLKNEYSASIDESSSLPEKLITVAGVQNRVYKNAVYKITSGDRKIYVSAEYATPLRTFKEVFRAAGHHSVYYEKYKKDIILQFYLTLEAVLEKNNLNEYCELIYYEDTYINEGVEQYYDVGKIILNRIKELKKLQHDKSE
ncbi:unnamed protein product [Acanthoscelides obtectus]|nr:unnamed protein product [Acanthoscelides obtectus]CAK1664179.1 Stimulator of interferon genes protein [Acanthoscelides obtectus]